MLRMVFRSRLDLSSAQRIAVDSIFAGPITILRRLAAYNKLIRTSEEAGIFLLLNRAEISPFLVGDRDATLQRLKELVVHLARNTPECLTLELRNWSLSRSGTVGLPVLGLRDVQLDRQCDRNALLQIAGRCTASLEHDGTYVYLKVDYEKELLFRPRDIKSPAKQPLKANRAAVSVTGTGKRCPVCHQPLVPDHWREHTNLLSSIVLDNRSRSNKGDIGLGSGGSIWAVSGGLPSLGKRAR